MKALKSIPIGVHAAVEMLAAPLLIVAPFVLGFGYAAGALSIALGVLLIGLAVSIYGDGERASVPLAAHAGLDHVLATVTIAVGIALLVRAPPPPQSSWSGSAPCIWRCPLQRGTAARWEPDLRLTSHRQQAVHISLLPVVPQETARFGGSFSFARFAGTFASGSGVAPERLARAAVRQSVRQSASVLGCDSVTESADRCRFYLDSPYGDAEFESPTTSDLRGLLRAAPHTSELDCLGFQPPGGARGDHARSSSLRPRTRSTSNCPPRPTASCPTSRFSLYSSDALALSALVA